MLSHESNNVLRSEGSKAKAVSKSRGEIPVYHEAEFIEANDKGPYVMVNIKRKTPKHKSKAKSNSLNNGIQMSYFSNADNAENTLLR
jgi:hypothetical protein